MKVLEVVGFARSPDGNRVITLPSPLSVKNICCIPGTRMVVSDAYNGAQSTYLNRADSITRVGEWLRLIAQTTTNNSVTRAACLVGLNLTDCAVQPDQLDSILTLGVRIRFPTDGNSYGAGWWTRASSWLLQINNTSGGYTNLVNVSDCDQPIVAGREHYFELQYDRSAGVIKVYRDNGFVKLVNFTPPNGFSFTGFSVGIDGQITTSVGGGTMQVYIKDIYLAEFLASDAYKRLGPQVVTLMPVAAVNATTWPLVNGTDKVASLNDVSPAMSYAPMTPTMLTVSEDDPVGTVQFDYSALQATDIINAISFQLDALATTGNNGTVNAELLQGSNSLLTKQLTFTGTYIPAGTPATSNYGKAVAIKTLAAPVQGNRGDVNTHSLRLKAAAAS